MSLVSIQLPKIDNELLNRALDFFKDQRFKFVNEEAERDEFELEDDPIEMEKYVKMLVESLDSKDPDYNENKVKIERLKFNFRESKVTAFSTSIGKKGFKKVSLFLAKRGNGVIKIYKCSYKKSYELAESHNWLVARIRSFCGLDGFTNNEINELEQKIRNEGDDFMKAIVMKGLAKELHEMSGVQIQISN